MQKQQQQQQDQSKPVDFVAKLVILGLSGVGKTNILLRFCDNQFFESHITTIGVDFKFKTFEIDGKNIKLLIYDTAGQERFQSIAQSYIKNAMGIIMAYAIDDSKSFEKIEKWLVQISEIAKKDVQLILVGNKCDMDLKRQVTIQQGVALADKFKIPFFEVSAKENINITASFEKIALDIKKNIFDKVSEEDVKFEQNKYVLKPNENINSTSNNISCCKN